MKRNAAPTHSTQREDDDLLTVGDVVVVDASGGFGARYNGRVGPITGIRDCESGLRQYLVEDIGFWLFGDEIRSAA